MQLSDFYLATIGLGIKDKNDLLDYCEKHKITQEQFDELLPFAVKNNEELEEAETKVSKLEDDIYELKCNTDDLKEKTNGVLDDVENAAKQLTENINDILKVVEVQQFTGKESFVENIKKWQKTTKRIQSIIENINTDF